VTLIGCQVEFELIQPSVENTFEVALGHLHDALGAKFLKVLSRDRLIEATQESVDLLLPAADESAVE